MRPTLKYLMYSLVIVLVTACSGCSDGRDGQAYLKHWWTGDLYYSDNNPGIPTMFYSDVYYEVSPGIYSFNYISWDSSYWSGTYVITREDGEKGILPLVDGDDGQDSYFELGLYSTGPTFYSWGSTARNIADNSSVPFELTYENEQSLSRNEVNEVTKDNSNLSPFFNPDSDGVITEEVSNGRYKMILKYSRM